ncbi:MAG: hypothetical protein ACHQWU_12650 [Gemmatimonadales bacterium]
MTSTDSDDSSEDANARAARRGRLGWRAALIFGFVAATIEMALVLWMAFC